MASSRRAQSIAGSTDRIGRNVQVVVRRAANNANDHSSMHPDILRAANRHRRYGKMVIYINMRSKVRCARLSLDWCRTSPAAFLSENSHSLSMLLSASS